MKYRSTRGGSQNTSFEDVLFSGYTPDGGLYVPQTVPVVTHHTLQEWSSLSYLQLAHAIIPLFISDSEISTADLHGKIDKAYTGILHADHAVVRTLADGLNILEMFYGPTLAFKDYSLLLVGELMEYFLKKSGSHTTIIVEKMIRATLILVIVIVSLVFIVHGAVRKRTGPKPKRGTSGDTGSSAIHAVKARDNIDIIVYLPHNRCTHIQELQMTTVLDDNVHVFAVDGSNDDLQIPINACLKDRKFVQKHGLCTINSSNWVRVLIQSVHYFYAYFQLIKEIGDTLEVVVPSGGGGNLSGGVLARTMGLPIQLVAVNNVNSVLARVLSTGEYSLQRCVPTLAVSMDIQECYNVERLVYLLSNYDVNATRDLMEEYQRNNGAAHIPPDILKKTALCSHVCSDELIARTMLRCYEENAYLICPHTATAVSYHHSRIDSYPRDAGTERVCIATASPDKFPEIVLRVGLTPRPHPAIDALPLLPTRATFLSKSDDWEAILRRKIRDITKSNANDNDGDGDDDEDVDAGNGC